MSPLEKAYLFNNTRFSRLETCISPYKKIRFCIDAEEIQNCLVELLQALMRRKKFKNRMINGRYLVAVDGSQKLIRDYQWQKEALERHVGEERIPKYYVYVLESVLILDNGITLPVLTERLTIVTGCRVRQSRRAKAKPLAVWHGSFTGSSAEEI